MSHYKTFAYSQAIQSLREESKQGKIELAHDEDLLLSTTGELCCATTANPLLPHQGP